MAHSRSDLHRKAAQAAAIKRAKACRHMHAPLVAATAVTVRDDGNPPRRPQAPAPHRIRSRPCDEAAASLDWSNLDPAHRTVRGARGK